MARYPTQEAVSAGGLVFSDRPDGRWVVLISRRSAAGALHWTLPKGRLEEGESSEQAALREVAEETGFACQITQPLGTIDYWFVWRPDKVRYHKFVHYFLMRYLGPAPAPRDDEAEEVVWLPVNEAMARLTHANERDLVARAVGIDDAGADALGDDDAREIDEREAAATTGTVTDGAREA